MRRLCPALLLVLALVPAARGEEWKPIEPAERARLDARVKSLKAEAEGIRNGAEAQFLVDQKACWKKILVTDCIEAARRRRIETIHQTRDIDLEANKLQLEINNRDLATREARQREEAPKKAAEQQAQIQEFQAEQAKAAADRQLHLQEKQREEAKGRAQRQAEDQARAKRLQERQNKVAPGSTATPDEEVRQRVADRDKRVAEKTAQREEKERQRAAERAAWEAKEKERQKAMGAKP